MTIAYAVIPGMPGDLPPESVDFFHETQEAAIAIAQECSRTGIPHRVVKLVDVAWYPGRRLVIAP